MGRVTLRSSTRRPDDAAGLCGVVHCLGSVWTRPSPCSARALRKDLGMAKRLRKTLPKDWKHLCETASVEELKEVLSGCQVGAVDDRFSSHTAWMLSCTPVEVVEWLVRERGAHRRAPPGGHPDRPGLRVLPPALQP